MYGSRCGEDFGSRSCHSPDVRPCQRQGDVAAGTAGPTAKRASARRPPPSTEAAFCSLSKDSRGPDLSHPGDRPILEMEDETLQREMRGPLTGSVEAFEQACLVAASVTAANTTHKPAFKRGSNGHRRSSSSSNSSASYSSSTSSSNSSGRRGENGNKHNRNTTNNSSSTSKHNNNNNSNNNNSNSSSCSSRERALLKRLQELEHYVTELETRLVALVPEEIRSGSSGKTRPCQDAVPNGVLEASQRALVAWEAAEEFLADPSASLRQDLPSEGLDTDRDGDKAPCTAGTLAQAAVLWSSVEGGPLEVSELLIRLAKLAMGRASGREPESSDVAFRGSSEDHVVVAADHPMMFDEAIGDPVSSERENLAEVQIGRAASNIERMPPVAARCGSRPEETVDDAVDETSPKTSWLLVRASSTTTSGPRTVRAKHAGTGEAAGGGDDAGGEEGGDASPFFDDASAPVFSEAAPTHILHGPRSIDQILAGSLEGNPCLLGHARRPICRLSPEDRALLASFRRNQIVIYHRIIRFLLRCWKEEAQRQVHPSLRGLLPASLLKPRDSKGQGVLSRAEIEKEKRVLQALKKHPPGFQVGSATLGAAASDISRTLSL